MTAGDLPRTLSTNLIGVLPFRQNIAPLRPLETAKSFDMGNDDNRNRNPILRRVPIIESSQPPSSNVSIRPSTLPPTEKTFLPSLKEHRSSPPSVFSASDYPPSSPPPDYHSVLSDDHDSTIRDEEDLRSTSTSVYETARSSLSPSPTREVIVCPSAQTPTLQSAQPQNYHHHQQTQPQVSERERDGNSMTTVIDKLDAATETVIPTSPVYFRTIVRRDHAGYGLTVCGTNPVTVRNIREGKLASLLYVPLR